MYGVNKKLEQDRRRRLCVYHFAISRRFLKNVVYNQNFVSFENREYFAYLLDKFPRNSSLTKIRNRCIITGKSNGVSRKLRLVRHMTKKFISQGLLFGLQKSSW